MSRPAAALLIDGTTIFDSGDVPLTDENGQPVLNEKGEVQFGHKTKVNMLPYRRKMQIVFQVLMPAWIPV